MKKLSVKEYAEIIIIGVLLLITIFTAFSAYIARRELRSYRTETLTRSFETLVSSLCSYSASPDPDISPKISECLFSLPLSPTEQAYSVSFCTDIAASRDDKASFDRSREYCSELLFYLSTHRSKILSSLLKASSLGMPEYPKGNKTLPTYTMPTEPQITISDFYREKAIEFLGSKAIVSSYSQKRNENKIYGFRTASSYVEYDSASGKVIKCLFGDKRGHGLPELESSELQKLAESEVSKLGYSVGTLIPDSSFYGITVFKSEGITVGLTSDKGELCLFSYAASSS